LRTLLFSDKLITCIVFCFDLFGDFRVSKKYIYFALERQFSFSAHKDTKKFVNLQKKL